MLIILRFCIIISTLRFWLTEAEFKLNLNESKAIIRRNLKLRDELTDLASPFVSVSEVEVPPRCVQMQCKFICFNGKSSEIEKDVEKVLEKSQRYCNNLEELRLYNYEFPYGIIQRNFLGNLNNRIQSLYIASSYVTDVEGGAFSNGIFKKLTLDNLKIFELRKNFFKNISHDFQSLTILQTDPPITSIRRGFLDYVKSQIKYLTLQVGINCVENMTASHNLLSNLAYLDYSYNDFGSSLTTNTFGMLSMVEHLDLSHSKITVLPNYIFSIFVSTLTYLDISHNHLKTLSNNIFGWQKKRNDLKIYANDNEWKCNCLLHSQMKILYDQKSPKISCVTPERYYSWSVFDNRLCEEIGIVSTTTTAISEGSEGYSTTPHTETTNDASNDAGGQTTEIPNSKLPITDNIELVCLNSNNTSEINKLIIKHPSMDFSIASHPNLHVDVILEVVNFFEDEKYGLIWFSKVTKEFYKMEINYKEYGLGCYGSISYRTTVKDLLPNAAYTFCIVKKDQPKVSPFSCKSVHIPGNVHIRYAWLRRDNRTTGISLTIFGVVLCTFVGILISFLILKQKPILLKGSKRVATTKANCNEIVVLPKDRSLDELRVKEEMLAKRSSKSNISNIHPRRASTVSSISYQSYMNTNVYEELPAYINIDSSVLDECTDKYILPRSKDFNIPDLVSYAEIPFRHKRTSNDPLPKVPKEQKHMSSLELEANGIFKHNIELSAGYAFAYDCVV